MAAQTVAVQSTCACKGFNFQVNLPISSLPFNRSLCLCNVCRRLSSSGGVSYIAVPKDQHFNSSKYNLTKYHTSEYLDRYFCTTCGAHVACNVTLNNTWFLATGLWDQTEGIIKWNGCQWVGDTLDGGISVWLKKIKDPDGQDRDLKRWVFRDVNDELVSPGEYDKYKRPQSLRPDTLKASCQCGGVKFNITRPNEAFKAAKSPFPDLMVPYHTGKSPANPENDPWWLCSNNTKYLAGLCTCNSCRTSMGFEIQAWAFIPRCNILQEDGTPLEYSMGTLKRYVSSKNVWREFCRVCGATVFWHCAMRPDLIDVNVGLFDPEEGARAENWLEWWTERVSFEEMAVSTSLVASLQDGLRTGQKSDSADV